MDFQLGFITKNALYFHEHLHTRKMDPQWLVISERLPRPHTSYWCGSSKSTTADNDQKHEMVVSRRQYDMNLPKKSKGK